MKLYQLLRSFCHKKLQIRSNFVTTCTIRSTRGAKLPVDATFSGRSMIEMLGVLAIIGVLSIGAINGYSRAMMKYKLNKQAEQLNTIFSAAQQYAGQIRFDNNASWTNYLATTLYKLKAIPDEMVTLNKNGNVSKGEDIWGSVL